MEDEYQMEGKLPPSYWEEIYLAAVFFEDTLILPRASLYQMIHQKELKTWLVNWSSLLSQIHGTSQQPAELQRKDEVLELTIKTVNIIRQGMKHKELKANKDDEYGTKKYKRRQKQNDVSKKQVVLNI
jgi:hypothetical protein